MNKYLDKIASQIDALDKEAGALAVVKQLPAKLKEKAGKGSKLKSYVSRGRATAEAGAAATVAGGAGYAAGKKKGKHTKKANIYLDAVVARLQADE